MARPVGAIRPHPLHMNLRTHEKRGIPGIKGIANTLTAVDDPVTRRLVLVQLREAVEYALDEIDAAL